MLREELFSRLDAEKEPWEVIIVGGGATGLGCAVDAATRGYRTVLLERGDFAQGTSSRSTKLVHGGVRYLRQGNVRLVLEALRERGRLLRNAADIVKPLPFIIPTRSLFEKVWYGAGLFLYSLLAGRLRIRWPAVLGRREAVRRLPTLVRQDCNGGVQYWDGQFDDAALAVALARTAAVHGGVPINYCEVIELLKDDAGQVKGVRVRDALDGEERDVRGKVVINATGVWADALRLMDNGSSKPMISPSKGSHIVLPDKYLPGEAALLVPETPDGRVVFAVPWQDRVIVGTTDIAMDAAPAELRPTGDEVDYIIETAAPYLGKIEKADILSVFSGLRPLVGGGGEEESSAISRDHTILTSKSGLVTVTGGKWTTYRQMAEEVTDEVAKVAELAPSDCRTGSMVLERRRAEAGAEAGGERYSEAFVLCKEDVVIAARELMAVTLADVLLRRSRCLVLDAAEAMRIAPRVAADLADVLGKPEAWVSSQVEGFLDLAREFYEPSSASPP